MVGTISILPTDSLRFRAGCNHYCIEEVNSEGSVALQCWGDNHYGQCGHPTHIHIAHLPMSRLLGPTVVSQEGFLDVELGCSHTCVTFLNHTVRCWGLQNALPAADKSIWFSCPLRKDASVFVGEFYTCFQDDDTRARCWGTSPYNSNSDLAVCNQVAGISRQTTSFPSVSSTATAMATTHPSSSPSLSELSSPLGSSSAFPTQTTPASISASVPGSSVNGSTTGTPSHSMSATCSETTASVSASQSA